MEHIHNEYCTTCDGEKKDESAKILRQKLRMRVSHMQNQRMTKTAQECRMEMIEKKIDKTKNRPLFKNPGSMPAPMEEDPVEDPNDMAEDK